MNARTATAIEPAEVRLMRRATGLAVATAALLIVGKTGAWLATDSVSLLSSLADSVMDVLASLINLLAVRQALKPPDREHRFGHGQDEPLAGLGQSLFIAGSGIFLLVEAAGRIAEPVPIEREFVGVAVMGVAIVLTLALVTYQRHVVRRTRSVAIEADSLHYASDILVNLGVIVALVLAAVLGWRLADPVIAILIAGFVVYAAVRIALGALGQLMDREFPDEERERIRAIVLEHPDVRDCHDLRTRRSGIDSFIQVHVEMDRSLTLMQAHAISDAVEARIRRAFPRAEVFIHADPDGIEETMPGFARR